MSHSLSLQQALERQLQSALKLELPYQDRSRKKDGASAAVLALFGFRSDRVGGPEILLMRRTETVASHKGQMAFPGGICESEELAASDFESTALRETEEEVGISRLSVNVLGRMPGLHTITGFAITPVVGTLSAPIDEVRLEINASEVAEAIWVPLAALRSPGTYRRELIPAGAVNYPIHVFQVGPHRVWGATASIIKNLLDRLQALS